MDFEVGQKAVFPAHGVGVIRSVTSMDFDGEEASFYEIKILNDGSTIFQNVERALAEGMRHIIPADAVERVLDVLRDRSKPADKQTWNRRYREYTQKIRTGDPLEVAAVLRDLALLKSEKTLSFGERKMYDKAFDLVMQELAVAMDSDDETVKKMLEDIFNS
ncbi:MAG: CarD family transcriptional regulator [Deltaproteobacteria bacterium]|nr:MAG: CarD family transcriptional regulator [Deltaproteobacteria bacterium]